MFRMTPNILKNLVSEKATRFYPYEVREAFAGTRGELVNRIEDCIFCGGCATKCPTGCISVDKKAGTWSCDPFACVYCGVCVRSCPKKCLEQKTAYRKPVSEKQLLVIQGTPPKVKKKETVSE